MKASQEWQPILVGTAFDLTVIGKGVEHGICNFRFPNGTLVLILVPVLNHIDLSSGCVVLCIICIIYLSVFPLFVMSIANVFCKDRVYRLKD